MMKQLAPYRTPHLCPAHAAAPPPCPRCESEWLDRSATMPRASVARRVFVAGLFAATVFGAVIGTAIGFVAGASPLGGAMASPSPDRARLPRATRPAPPPPRVVPSRPMGSGSLAPSLMRPRAPAEPPISAVTPLLARLGDVTNDPEVLVARLQGLARAGVPVVVETRRLSRATRDALVETATATRSLRVIPALRDGRTVGLKLYGIAPGGALARAGARSGDLLLAVNGIDVGEPRWPEALEPFPGDVRTAVFELERAGEHRVVVLRW